MSALVEHLGLMACIVCLWIMIGMLDDRIARLERARAQNEGDDNG